MLNSLRKAAKITAYAGGGLLGALALYGAAALTLSRIPVRRRRPDGPATVECFILSNGVHTDIVVPVRHAQMDWSRLIAYADTPAADASMDYLGFGWGDKGFYLNTPTWAELQPRVAFEAMFWLSTTAMHATFHHRPAEGPECVRITLTRREYNRLIRFILASFALDRRGRARHIEGHSYGRYDAFYEAKGTYNLFYTCNSWANAALKAAGQRAALWTPFDHGIFRHYR
ncbi:TIGR02117 family protein [Hymenobacter sp. 15J16-1T3B]|uniref:TIGR02117 family protein n=1 Tax=Hymenobacter sp. 15J16-1T3B TaxID=2886941 RepID=UPI001D12D0EB|nr:TIGR02117 family protein [Hymenobacter sp. 15J16-1T3B]MCC3160778.1 TIGR02117 family protein [Hymenobacter sp. 15J16-1T3B]